MRLLITGAGFSKAWGLPLTKELAQAILDALAAVPRDEFDWMMGAIRDFVVELQRVHGAEPDLEVILTFLRERMDEEYEGDWPAKARRAWEDLRLNQLQLRRAPIGGVPDPAFHYNALIWGIGAAIHWRGWGKTMDQEGLERLWSGIPQAYARLLNEHGPFDAIISLNYDVVPEYMFYGAIDYGLPDDKILDVLDLAMGEQVGLNGQDVHRCIAEPRRRFPNAQLVLKLHGSSNMAYCPTCDRALLFPRRLPGPHGAREPAEQMAWIATAGYRCTLHCGKLDPEAPPLSPGRLRPLIVPPVAKKEELPEWSVLKPIHERALEAAKQATSVLIVGTSLRPTDTALTAVLEALACPVQLIGDEHAESRLQELGIPYAFIRRHLDETPEDRTQVVKNKRGIKIEPLGTAELGPGIGRDGMMDRQSWRRLPSAMPDQTYLVLRLGCAPERGRLRQDPLGHFPWMDVVEAGTTRRLRLPMELQEWAKDRVSLARAGMRDIPGRVRLMRRSGTWTAHVYGP